ncbi:MAG TPA: nitronate monooxygenase, partial [Bacteriovoracaceae bacterium]|nr:nitronate monooxygenase [Bacteriovoracaceae bacterium]
ASVLIPGLKKICKIPVISAGGVGSGSGIISMLALGADGLSIGSPFIASKESGVSEDYKNACVNFGAKDIVVTTRLSGSRCTVINTPYMQKSGIEQNLVERLLNNNKQLKKYAKMLTYYKGMKMIEKAAFSATYKSVWCAGSSIEFTDRITTVSAIVDRFKIEMQASLAELAKFQDKK